MKKMMMKTQICIGLLVLLFSCKHDPQSEMKKMIVGEWCNPYTYESSGELKGFRYLKGGACEAINIPSLELKTWKIEDGYLITEGYDISDQGNKEVYKTRERISKLNRDTLMVVTQEASPRLEFIYLNTKVIKERVKPAQ